MNKIILGIVCFIIIFFLGYIYGTYYPQNTIITKLVEKQLVEAKAKLVEDLRIEKDKYIIQVKIQDAKIDELNKKLGAFQTNYQNAQIEIERLRKELAGYVKATNIKDVRERLEKIGYSNF